MPVINQYSAERISSGVPQMRAVSASDLSGGKALSDLGAGLANAGQAGVLVNNEIQKKAAEIEKRKDELAAEAAFSSLQVELARQQDAMAKQETPDFSNKSLGIYDKMAQETLAGLADKPSGYEHLKLKIIKERDNFFKNSLAKEAYINVRRDNNNARIVLNNSRDIVLADPSRYNEQKQAVIRAINLGGASPSEKKLMETEAAQTLAGSIWMSLPEGSRMQAVSAGNSGGFDNAMGVVFRNEGGYTASDGATGSPALFGINEKFHPEAFRNAASLMQSGRKEEAKAAAADFYRKNFWDKYQIDSLPANTQTIVMDGVVNHRSEFAGKLTDAARTEPPDALIAMRLGEYQRLAQANPGKYGASLKGWENRLKNLSENADHELFNDLSPDDKIKALREADKLRFDSAKHQLNLLSVESGSYLYQPKKQQMEAIDAHYANEVAGAGQLSEGESLQFAADYIKKYKVIPTAVQNTVRGMVRSGDGNQAVAAVDIYNQIKTDNIKTLDDFSGDDIRSLENLSNYLRLGYSPGDAAAKIREMDMIAKAVKQDRLEEYQTQAGVGQGRKIEDINRKFLIARTHEFFRDDPDNFPREMLGDFDNIAASEYQISGNLDAAREIALKTLRRNWDVSYISGSPEYKKLPPEKIYAVPGLDAGQNALWIKEQLMDDFKNSPLYKQGTPANIQTVRLIDGTEANPAYMALFETDDGYVPFAFRPDYLKSKAYEKAVADKKIRDNELEKQRKKIVASFREGTKAPPPTTQPLIFTQ